MLFSSLSFLLLFLPIALFGSVFFRSKTLLIWLTFISCLFYQLSGEWWFLIPMGITVVIDFFIGQLLTNPRFSSAQKKAFLMISLTANLGLLIFFKYTFFILKTGWWFWSNATGNVSALPSWTQHFALILPAGISFYTFQTLSYILDVWFKRCKPEKNFFHFTSFVTFFPHLVAGPLTRHNQLIPQLVRLEKKGFLACFDRKIFQSGLLLFAVGLSKKVLIADRIASYIDPILNHTNTTHGIIGSWLLLLGYTLQIYFDFSGYSDMAIGLGRLWSIELPINFNKPYRATDPSDFWQRWHITLSQWLRDYLYIPLGGNRKNKLRTDLNLMITMCLGGLWHGANWTFLFWGFYHGTLLILHRRFENRWKQINDFSKRTFMFLLTMIGWLFFRSENSAQLISWSKNLIGLNGIGFDFFLKNNFSKIDLTIFLALLLMGLIISMTSEKYKHDLTTKKLTPLQGFGLGISTAASIVFMSHSTYFLYFKF